MPRPRRQAGERASFITALTKLRLAEDLSTYLREAGVRCRYIHSEIDAIERVEILKALRQGAFDVLVGVNLLREGLDLPEVSRVLMLDADKEGFLRSKSSLIQNIGRAARNVGGEVILYADKITAAMRDTLAECSRRRARQLAYNSAHNITPQTIHRAITDGIEAILAQRDERALEESITGIDSATLDKVEQIKTLEGEMEALADELRFEEAANLRDRILELKGEARPQRGIGGLRKMRGKRAAPAKALRLPPRPGLLAAEEPAPYGRRKRS